MLFMILFILTINFSCNRLEKNSALRVGFSDSCTSLIIKIRISVQPEAQPCFDVINCHYALALFQSIYLINKNPPINNTTKAMLSQPR
jgi:hypothetical protein